MKKVLGMVMIVVLSGVFMSYGQDAKPAPAPATPVVSPQPAPPQPTPEDKMALDAQLVSIQLTALKDYTLSLQADNRRLQEENKKLKDELAAKAK